METAEEKAKRLGVPIISPIQRMPDKTEDERKKDRENSEAFKKYLIEQCNETVSVCGGCGKEIKKYGVTSPCGKSICPFGGFAMSSPIGLH